MEETWNRKTWNLIVVNRKIFQETRGVGVHKRGWNFDRDLFPPSNRASPLSTPNKRKRER